MWIESWINIEGVILATLVTMRVMGALYSPIPDCDESFNFWEARPTQFFVCAFFVRPGALTGALTAHARAHVQPAHFLSFGFGMQTWEYAPQYALRSYSYLVPHALVASAASKIAAACGGMSAGLMRTYTRRACPPHFAVCSRCAVCLTALGSCNSQGGRVLQSPACPCSNISKLRGRFRPRSKRALRRFGWECHADTAGNDPGHVLRCPGFSAHDHRDVSAWLCVHGCGACRSMLL